MDSSKEKEYRIHSTLSALVRKIITAVHNTENEKKYR
jgi:hypothetical protein